jgi:Spy/CpxP family protein refolding chaperone
MKTPALILALLLVPTVTSAVSAAEASASPVAQSQPLTRLAGWFETIRDDDNHGERRHHGRHSDDDDDDDDGDHHGRRHDGERHGDRDGGHAGRGGDNRSADPNAATTPVPDNGVFNGKTRPKVEVQ